MQDKKNYQNHSRYIAAALSLLTLQTHAATESVQHATPVMLDTVTVTAPAETGDTERQTSAPPVIIVGREQIEAYEANTVGELLRRSPCA